MFVCMCAEGVEASCVLPSTRLMVPIALSDEIVVARGGGAGLEVTQSGWNTKRSLYTLDCIKLARELNVAC